MKQLYWLGSIYIGVLLVSVAKGAETEVTPTKLTLKQAQEYALIHHPDIQAADFRARAAEQQIREARSLFFPQVTANATAVASNDNTRIAASGALNNPTILPRESNGVLVDQLITDFGRTADLTSSSRYQAYSIEQIAQAQRAQVLLNVTRAYFAVLSANAILGVAKQTVEERQSVLDRVTALAKNNLKSSLDVSFSQVSLDQASLLLLNARNGLDEAFAMLSEAMGSRGRQLLALSEEPMPGAPPDEVDPLIQQALDLRPEIIAAKAQWDAAVKYAAAQQAGKYPVITAIGAAGVSPVHDHELTDTYATGGVNVALPLFTGGRLSAQAEEALMRAHAEQKVLEEEQNQIARDVQIAWLNCKSAFRAIEVTQALLTSANHAMDLAQSRYNLGVSSVVELNQAQLQTVDAQIAYTRACYTYQVRRTELDYQLGILK